MSLKYKNPAELLEVIEEAERCIAKEECFCTTYNKDIIAVALEALDRLRVVSETISGQDEEAGFVTGEE